MDEASSSSSSSSSSVMPLGNTRAIDRHNPIIRDSRRITKSFPPCSSAQHPPVSPIPYAQLHQKPARTASSKPHDKKNRKGVVSKSDDQKRKSSVVKEDADKGVVVRKSSVRFSDFVTPPGSTRYLLGDQHGGEFLDLGPGFDPGLGHVEPKKCGLDDESSSSVSKSSVSSDSPQVVVLRVSLHCRGCEGKVRKHISRMKGVTSYNIDFAAKKVTVVGDVTPLGVLASVSKIKAAQLWTPSMSSLPTSDLKKHKAAGA